MSDGYTLRQLTEEQAALDEVLEEHQGDITGAESIIAQWFEELGDAVESKVDGYCGLITDRAARAKARREEADRIAALADVDDNKVEVLKRALRDYLTARQLRRLDCPRFAVWVQTNGGQTPVDVFAPVEVLPADCVRVVKTADVDAIRARLEAGESLPFAKLLPRGSHLRLR